MGIEVSTASSHDSTFVTLHSIKVNHLGTALMTLLLLPHMKATADVHGVTPRIVIVSSGQHMLGVIPKVLIDSEAPILQRLSSKEFSSSS